MSRRRTHARAGFVGTAATLVGIAIAGHQDPSLPVLAGATQLYHFAAGMGLALACGWAGARLPDWIEPARTPHHRGFWHSKALGGALLVLSGLLAGGVILGQSRPVIFLVRIAALFLAVGYITHLGLDVLSQYGLPRLRNPSRAVRGIGLSSAAAKPIVWIGLGVLTVGTVRAFWVFMARLYVHERIWQPLLFGIGIGAALDHFLLRRWAKGLHTFVHETAHAVAALLLGRRITRFVSTRSEGGVVHHQGRFGGEIANTIIALAPYFWPTFAVIAVLARPLIASEWFPAYDVLIGATIGFHSVTSARDLNRNSHGDTVRRGSVIEPTQTDIAKCGGLLVSSVYIAIAALTTYSLLVAVIMSGYTGLNHWVEVVVRGTWTAVCILGDWVREALSMSAT
jgi:hypothetical protein